MWFPCLHLPTTEITDVHYKAFLYLVFLKTESSPENALLPNMDEAVWFDDGYFTAMQIFQQSSHNMAG